MITIQESPEELVDIHSVCADVVIQIDPARQKLEKTMYARETVVKMLAQARSYLPKEITFVLKDAWRPLAAQKMYFDYYYRKVQRENPSWSDKKVYLQSSKFAIPPDQKFRAGHMTGAAIDLSLWKNGRRLPMSSTKLSFEKRAKTNSLQLSDHINKNRALLRDVMERAGFVNYPNEFWHYCYGDTMWAELTSHKTAMYGPVEAI